MAAIDNHDQQRPFFCEGSPAMVELETMIDRVGLANVLYAMASICGAREEHLQANWQDAEMAKLWAKWGNKINACATRLGK